LQEIVAPAQQMEPKEDAEARFLASVLLKVS
jgi:hypothetical protein